MNNFDIVMLAYIVFIAISIGIVIDAKKNNMNGIIWGILNFIFPIVGMIIYLIVRASKKSAQTKCEN